MHIKVKTTFLPPPKDPITFTGAPIPPGGVTDATTSQYFTLLPSANTDNWACSQIVKHHLPKVNLDLLMHFFMSLLPECRHFSFFKSKAMHCLPHTITVITTFWKLCLRS